MDTKALFRKFESTTVLVIGDFIVDVNTYVENIKPLDDSTPVYRAIPEPNRGKTDIYSEGGAALVVRNLLELGAEVDFITAFGYGSGALHAIGFSPPRCRIHSTQVRKPQTVKHRYWCEGKKVFAVDVMDNAPLTETEADGVMLKYALALSHADVVVVADYRHGLISEPMAKRIVELANKAGKPIYVSSQVAQSESNHHWYKSETTRFVMNAAEIGGSKESGGWEDMYITLGDRGCQVFLRDNHMGVEIPAIKVSGVDSCGAGDAYLSALSLSKSAVFANTWAGLSCTVKGANPPTRKMLEDWCNAHS